MANETTRTSLTEIVNSEVIADLILQYAADATVISPHVRVLNLAGRASATASFPQWELDAVADITTEGTTTLSNTELQTTEVATISAAQVGVMREVTEMAWETNTLGRDGLMQFVVEDGAKLCILEIENDLAALFSGFSTTVGTSGSDLSVANYVEAIARMDTLNARGLKVCILDDQQAFDLRAAVAASTGTVFANSAQPLQSILKPGANGYVGSLFEVENWMTNLTDTANGGADVVGSMFISGSASPEFAGLGMALLWMPRVRSLALPDQLADQIAISACYGVGRISDFGVDITTDA